MANKIKIILFINMIFFQFSVFSQTIIGPNEDYSKKEFVQKLEWNKDLYASEYEVEIQDENFKTVFLKRTKENIVKFSLNHGKYRYRIFVYDLFGKRFESLTWTNLDIIKINRPYIYDLDNKIVNVEKGSSLSIPLKVTGINENSKIKIVQYDRKKSYDVKLTSFEKNKIEQDESFFCVAHISSNDFSEGKYFFFVENPGDVIFEGASFELKYVTTPVILNFEPSNFNVIQGSIVEIKIQVHNYTDNSKIFVISSDNKKTLCQIKSIETRDSTTILTFVFNASEQGRFKIKLENDAGFSSEVDGLIINYSLQPKIIKVNDGFFYINNSKNFETTFSAIDLLSSSIVKLVPKDEFRKTIYAKSIEKISDQSYIAKFSSTLINSGLYTLEIENPGNLKDSMGSFEFSVIEGVDLNLGLGLYAGTIILLYNDMLPDYTHSTFSLGAMAEVSIIPFKYDFGYLGFDFDLMCSYWKRKINSVDNKIYSGIVSAQVLYQKPFLYEALRIQVGIGGGYSVFGHNEVISENREFAQCPILKSSVDIIWYPIKRLYVDFGIDYVHLFEKENYSGLLIPQFIIGTRF